MSLFRDNLLKQLTSRKAATVLMRTILKADTAGTITLGIFVCRPMEASP
ncbi:MAG: hypothetical protein JW715_08000 [Sedimentisphaerales bacterium]|nr:hypothetical protein [Sedimentisphaerales bacterium]